jgi:tetratricopeptide (TPR) repeat protein
MPERPYMVIDWRADHSLRVPRPDLTLETGVPNACSQAGCHDDKPDKWSADHYTTWYGRARKPHYGTILAEGRNRRPEAEEKLIRLAGDELYPTIVRATALQLLGAYPGEASAAAFNRALSDPEPLVRYTAVLHVNITDPERLKEFVAPLLFDPIRAVRMQSAVRLAGLPRELFKPYQIEALEETIEEYEAAMTYSLDFAFAGHNLGNLYATMGDAEKAMTFYEAAIEIDDLFYPAKANLAVLYNTQGRNDEAERLFREIVEDYPEQYESSYSLGLLLAEMNRFDEAAVYLRRAAEGMPEHGRAWYNLGLIEQAQGRLPEAERALQAAVNSDPSNIDFLFALADHYIKRGELERARSVADRMIEVQPGNQTGHDIKAYVDRLLNGEAQ